MARGKVSEGVDFSMSPDVEYCQCDDVPFNVCVYDHAHYHSNSGDHM